MLALPTVVSQNGILDVSAVGFPAVLIARVPTQLAMKISTIIWFALALALAGAWVFSSFKDRKEERSFEKARQDRVERIAAAKNATAKRYGSVVDWNQSIREKNERLGAVSLSVDYQDALIRPDRRSVLIAGDLEDVAHYGDHFRISIRDWEDDIGFILDCDADTARTLRGKSDKAVSVIADIASVEKAALRLKSGGKSEEDEEPIEIDSSSIFSAYGRVLAVVSDDGGE
jgi:hypothetical protein